MTSVGGFGFDRAGASAAARSLGIACLIGVLTGLSIRFTRAPDGVTVVWAASGVLAGILLTAPSARWPSYLVAGLVGALVARAALGDPASSVFCRAIACTLEAAVVAYSLQHWVGDSSDPTKLSRVSTISLISTLLGCAASAFMVALIGASAESAFSTVFISWFVSHALGMVIFATLVVVARRQGVKLFGRPGRRWAFMRTMALLACTTAWVFQQSEFPLLFLIYPPLLLAVFRHHFSGVVVGIVVVMVISVVATLLDSGPLQLVHGASLQQRVLLLQLFIAAACLLALPVAMALAERGRIGALLRESEQNYRLLAENARDIVVRMRADGKRLYVSPSVREMLGYAPEELMASRWDLVHADDRQPLAAAITRLFESGEETTVVYRALHRAGHFVWIEVLARRVPAKNAADGWEIIYSGRNVTARKQVEQSLAQSEAHLRAIADNLPAMVMRVDTEQRYTFVNAHLGSVFGLDPEQMLGRTIREFVNPQLYAAIEPRISAALRGERQTFEGEIEANGKHYYRQANYIPDRRADGGISGFYSLTYDITELHAAKQELLRLAQHDPLTGLGNRNKFGERLSLASARAARSHRPLALIYLDIDHFKQINDTHGHAAGDALLCEFARRLSANIRKADLAIRMGGDEFAVLIEDAESHDTPERVAAKLVEAMRPAIAVQANVALRITTSVGVATCLEPVAMDVLMHAADAALYEAKAAGRNGYRVRTIPPSPDASEHQRLPLLGR